MNNNVNKKQYGRFDSLINDTGSISISRKFSGFDEVFWHKIIKASEGNEILNSKDVERILTMLKNDNEIETETKIASLIVNRLKSYGDLLDEGFLRYLSENYNKLIPLHEENENTLRDSENDEDNNQYINNFDHITQNLSSGVVDLLRNIYSWNFDIFQLQELIPSPLGLLLTHCLREYYLIDSLGFNSTKFQHFIHDIHDSYNPLPYHNALHAADVTQTTFYFLSTGRVIDALNLNQISVASILIASAVHDVNHPGVNGKFLITTHSPLAIEYSDHSPLEMMHLATTFTLWRDDKNNFTDGIPNGPVLYREMRRLIIEMVLLTDNDMHFSLLNKLDRAITMTSTSSSLTQPPQSPQQQSSNHIQQSSPLFSEKKLVSSNSNNSLTENGVNNNGSVGLSARTQLTHPTIDDRQLLLLQVTLHTADVSNTAKPWNTYNRWMTSIMEEFYLQGDKERALGMPISYAFDRYNPVTQSKFQLGFIKAIVGPLFKTFSKVEGIELSECLDQLSHNSKKWKELVEEEESNQIISSLASTSTDNENTSKESSKLSS